MTDIQKALEDIRKEISESGKTTRIQIEQINTRMEDFEKELKNVKRSAEADVKIISEHSLEEKAKLGLTIGNVTQLSEQIVQTTEAVSAIVDELGLEGKVKLGRSTPPGVKITSKLSKISRENKSGTAASIIATILLIVQIVWKIMEHS